MSKHILFLVIAALLLLPLFTYGCTRSGGDTDVTSPPAPAEIKEIKSFSFGHSGMSTDSIYTYSVEQTENGELLYVELNAVNNIIETVLDEPLLSSLEALVARHNLYAWDGYKQRNDMVLDGESFSLSVVFADGSVIQAHGNNAFPKGYADAASDISALFSGPIEQYGDFFPKELESDALDYIFVNFNGAIPHHAYRFVCTSMKDGTVQIDFKIDDASGEFRADASPYQFFGFVESFPFDEIQAIVREYDMPSWNGWDKTAENYSECEWFQLDFGYDSGETISAMGTLYPDNYDEVRAALIRFFCEYIEQNEQSFTPWVG